MPGFEAKRRGWCLQGTGAVSKKPCITCVCLVCWTMCVFVCVCAVTHVPLTFFSHSPIMLAWTSLWHCGIISRHALTGSAPSPVCCCCVGCPCLFLRKNKRDWGKGDFFCDFVFVLCFQIRAMSELITYPHLILIQLSNPLSSHLQQKDLINKSNNWMSELESLKIMQKHISRV